MGVRALAGHQFAAGLQYALTEGVTALCLIALIWAVTGNAKSGRVRPTTGSRWCCSRCSRSPPP